MIAVTAYASAEYRDRCQRAGFQGHVAKRYDTAELIREIAATIGRAQAEPSQRL